MGVGHAVRFGRQMRGLRRTRGIAVCRRNLNSRARVWRVNGTKAGAQGPVGALV
jgi:hypothetical protein